MKGLTRAEILRLINNSAAAKSICHSYTDDDLKIFFSSIDGDLKPAAYKTTYKRIIMVPMPMIDKMWIILRPELMTAFELKTIYKWMWETLITPIYTQYEDSLLPQQMYEFNVSYLNNEINNKAYNVTYNRYYDEYANSLLSEPNVPMMKRYIIAIAGTNCALSNYVFHAVKNVVLCAAAHNVCSEDEVYQRIIDECILKLC